MGRKEWKEISDKRYYKAMVLVAMSGMQVDPKDAQELDGMTAALNYIDSEEDKQLQQWKEVASKLALELSGHSKNLHDQYTVELLQEYEALTKQ